MYQTTAKPPPPPSQFYVKQLLSDTRLFTLYTYISTLSLLWFCLVVSFFFFFGCFSFCSFWCPPTPVWLLFFLPSLRIGTFYLYWICQIIHQLEFSGGRNFWTKVSLVVRSLCLCAESIRWKKKKCRRIWRPNLRGQNNFGFFFLKGGGRLSVANVKVIFSPAK